MSFPRTATRQFCEGAKATCNDADMFCVGAQTLRNGLDSPVLHSTTTTPFQALGKVWARGFEQHGVEAQFVQQKKVHIWITSNTRSALTCRAQPLQHTTWIPGFRSASTPTHACLHLPSSAVDSLDSRISQCQPSCLALPRPDPPTNDLLPRSFQVSLRTHASSN